MNTPHLRFLSLVPLAVLASVVAQRASAREESFDVVIYGGTSGGVTAAIQTRRLGKSVVLIEPGRHLGGLTTGGLGATDIGNKEAIGGLSREFYRRIKQRYDEPRLWRFERREQYRSPRQRPDDDAMWTFEPHVAEQLMDAWVQEAGVRVVRGERLDRKRGVALVGGRITAITLESGQVYAGRQFVDATYEGDLMAAAGVSFHVGRESNAIHDETLNGVQTRNAVHHQFMPRVDPYVIPGDPQSGLLPGLHNGPPGDEGAGDHRVQAYCFRMCVTDVEENRLPFEKPDGYDPARYELLLRNFEAGETRVPWSPTMMPNRKTDTNNNHGFSTDNIGMSYSWPAADYDERDRIFREHLLYQRGLMWTLAHHPRVPEEIRREVSRWGNCRDEFPENHGWSTQLYVREARRMVSDYVMSQHDCEGTREAPDPVGLAAYTMDSHNVQRYVDAEGQTRNEGDVQVGGFPPYPISYRSIVPKTGECPNLLVPVCMSASHIAYGSIRMEPVFMVLGQSAATAACLAIDDGVEVQRVEYAKLRDRLLEDKQVLRWTGPRPKVSFLDPARLKGIVLDDIAMERHGEWVISRSTSGFVGGGYWHDNNEAKGQKRVVFTTRITKGGEYEVRLAYTPHANRATNVPVTISVDSAPDRVKRLDQRQTPPLDGAFVSLGTFPLKEGQTIRVTIANQGTDGYVVADAVQLLRVGKE